MAFDARVTITQIKVVHTIIFAILSGCVILVLYSGLANRVTGWTWLAIGLILVEGVVLMAFGWTCPLTIAAERLGARSGAVADIYLPKCLADRIFPVCSSVFLLGCLLVAWRLWVS